MTQSNLYPIRHGSPARDSAIAGQSSAEGRVAWSSATGKESTPFWPGEILIWDDLVLVSTYEDVLLFDASGKRLWERKKQGGVPVSLAGDGRLYLKNPSLFLDSINRQGEQILKSAPFPGGMSAEFEVEAFWPRAKDFVAVTFQPPENEQRSEEAELAGPSLTLIRNEYPTTYGDYLRTFDSNRSLAPLMLPASSIVALMLDDEVVRIDVDREAELPRFKSPLREMVEWSADAEGTYVITGYENGRKVIVAISSEGKTLWRWEDESDSDAWATLQPPIRHKTGRVYALTEGRVLAIDAGKLAWVYDLRSEMLRHGSALEDGSFEIKDGKLLAKAAIRHGSSLADGSLLVTSGKQLFHLDAAGRKRFSLTLDSDILSSPVIDAQGNIYVTTATHLFKIQ